MLFKCFLLFSVLFTSCRYNVEAFCWEPGTSPFTGPPKSTRLPEGDRIQIDWTSSFKDNPDCENVDFMVMMHPRTKPSAYKISDFTQKGQRIATINVEKDQDYVFQVIARENKSSNYGIDYKFSDMINNFAKGGKPGDAESTTKAPARTVITTMRTPTSTMRASLQTNLQQRATPPPPQTTTATTTSPTTKSSYSVRTTPPTTFSENLAEKTELDGLDPNPWYIYECIPFLKDVPGYNDKGEDNSNTILVNFIRQMNKKPIEIVEEFLTNQKNLAREKLCANGSKPYQDFSQRVKGYVVTCNDKSEGKVCCPSPWSTDCRDVSSNSVCFRDFKSCDGGRCVHPTWIGDDWPDCLDGSDEISDQQLPLPRQLVCVQCAGVVLSAGFMCRESALGLTRACVNDVMGHDGACNACVSQYLNIS